MEAIKNNPKVEDNYVALIYLYSEKDEEDLKWAIGMGADFIALSFVS